MIRPAQPEDLEWCARLERDCFGEDAWSYPELAGELQRDCGIFLVTGTRGACIGWVMAGEAELLRIAVHPRHRRHGLGRALLGAFEAAARSQGARRAFLEVRRDNAAARGLYEARGWRTATLRRRYYADGVDAVLMELNLQKSGLKV